MIPNENAAPDESSSTSLETLRGEEDTMESKPESFVCPECQKAGKKVAFGDKRGLGAHRHAKHGVAGVAPSTLAYHQKHNKKVENKKVENKKVEKPIPAKKSHHPVKAKPEVTAPTAKALVVQKRVDQSPISAALMGYAMGRLESLAEQIARENGLPEKEFVRVVSSNLADLAKR
jgi:hypothetical protein